MPAEPDALCAEKHSNEWALTAELSLWLLAFLLYIVHSGRDAPYKLNACVVRRGVRGVKRRSKGMIPWQN